MAGQHTTRLLFAFASLSVCLVLFTQAEACITEIRVERVVWSTSYNLSCARLKGDERIVTLEKEKQRVHNFTILGQNTAVEVNENLRLLVEGDRVVYEFKQVTEREAGVYTCELQRNYPPPYKAEVRMSALFTEPLQRLTLEPGPPRLNASKEEHQTSPVPSEVCPPPVGLWSVCIGVSMLCAVAIVIALVLGHKLYRNARQSTSTSTLDQQSPNGQGGCSTQNGQASSEPPPPQKKDDNTPSEL
ncbi:uncharacterized protein LOC116223768 isoform X2 [Clupea harengus]|uniref:Uncharacterized protein LOC116223768 isoform X2 n=1 Tax=Clupea harengus TaxID=7950 RepID=A0A6P8GRU6_CLUHA|nr:uncharacterized protein LOC116223768 isoform X2 [Clupea harengus]